MWTVVRKVMLRHFADSRWYTIVLVSLVYASLSWLLLYAAGESALTNNIDFIYWLAVTASTVGYGDLSPVTSVGKLIVVVFVIPLGLSIFAMIIGRVAAWVSNQWSKGLMGLTSLHVRNHILVIGWNEQRTLSLLNLLLKEREAMLESPAIVLCVRAEIANPMPGKIEFVKVDSFNKDEDMDAACVANAATILIDNPQDDVTLTTALYCSQRNPNAHQVAYFEDDSLVKLLRQHSPNVECTPSVSVEMLAKAAFDPGSSVLHHDLLSVDDDGQAQFSVAMPENSSPTTFGHLFITLKQQYDAILIGVAPQSDYRAMELNPSMDTKILPNDKLFYIAKVRIRHFDWTKLSD
jgi:voltage-gated potassium channel